MRFLWPKMLVLVVVGAPLLLVGYVALARQRARRVAALAAQGFVPTAATLRTRRRRHVPFAFFLAAVTLLLAAFARPSASLSLPHREGTVILAFDVSSSMVATDLLPTRIDAAKAAARTFVARQPSSIKIGVVAFSDGGLVTQAPTDVKADVLAAIDRLKPQGGTSLGKGVFTALNAIAGKPIELDDQAVAGNFDNLDVGYFSSAAIVLLSDGENTSTPDPLEVAKLASAAGVRIYPIGIGSTDGTVVKIDGFSVATKLDEEMLTNIASVSDGAYFNATDEASLVKVYDKIDLKFTSEPRRTEITGLVAGVSTLLLFVGAGLSLAWFGRVV
jgi:Ca-activated chloride channel family protein